MHNKISMANLWVGKGEDGARGPEVMPNANEHVIDSITFIFITKAKTV